MSDGERKKPFWVKCGPCAHCWIAAYTPMVAELFATVIKNLRCPMCGAGDVFVAKQQDGELQEPKAT